MNNFVRGACCKLSAEVSEVCSRLQQCIVLTHGEQYQPQSIVKALMCTLSRRRSYAIVALRPARNCFAFTKAAAARDTLTLSRSSELSANSTYEPSTFFELIVLFNYVFTTKIVCLKVDTHYMYWVLIQAKCEDSTTGCIWRTKNRVRKSFVNMVTMDSVRVRRFNLLQKTGYDDFNKIWVKNSSWVSLPPGISVQPVPTRVPLLIKYIF